MKSGNRPIAGNVVDVMTGRIFPGKVYHDKGVITRVEPAAGSDSGFLLPGLIDSHIHVDSSFLCPSRFAEAVVPRGTTAVITDPHEIGNVLGVAGISYMREDSASVPLRMFFTAPSCVPATPFETSGASIGPDEIESLMSRTDVVALGEVMNYTGAIDGSPDVMAKIRAAKTAGKPVDGHCPMLTGENLRKYVAIGISTDHECTSAEEAFEKHGLGMRIMVRQGSAAKNLPALARFAKEHDFFLVSDDKTAPDLIDGHMDLALAQAVDLGIDPIHAIRAATIRPAEHYLLPLGAIVPGRKADIVRVRDLSSFSVEEVYIGGKLAAEKGKPAFAADPVRTESAIAIRPRRSSDFSVPATGSSVTVRVISVIRDEIVTGAEAAVLKTNGGSAVPDTDGDILAIAVVNRYRDAPVSLGFVKGFGLKSGAIASSVAHDSHNIIVVGCNPDDMAGAVNTVIRMSGGCCMVAGGTPTVLPLQIAGLMSTESPVEVRRGLERLEAKTREAGCTLDSPFMTLSFMSLLVIPRLKIGDRGLFDVDASRFVAPVLP